MQEEQDMTLAQALEAGYFICIRPNEEMWTELKDIDNDYIKEYDDIYLGEKEVDTPCVPDAERLIEKIVEEVMSYSGEDTWDAVQESVDPFKEELQTLLDKISAKIKLDKSTQTYSISHVHLIPDPNL